QGGFRVAPPTPECYRPAVTEGHSVTPGAAGPSWLLRLLLIGLVVAGVAWLYYGLDLPGHASVAGMHALVDAHAPYGPLVFMAILVAGILTQTPMMGHLLVAVGGVLWSAIPAFVYGWVGAMVGTTATFLFVRYVAREPVQRALYGRFARLAELDERLAAHGFGTVCVLRLLMLFAPILNWGLGLTRVRTRDYLAGTALGIVPGIAVTVFFADSLVTQV